MEWFIPLFFLKTSRLSSESHARLHCAIAFFRPVATGFLFSFVFVRCTMFPPRISRAFLPRVSSHFLLQASPTSRILLRRARQCSRRLVCPRYGQLGGIYLLSSCRLRSISCRQKMLRRKHYRPRVPRLLQQIQGAALRVCVSLLFFT